MTTSTAPFAPPTVGPPISATTISSRAWSRSIEHAKEEWGGKIRWLRPELQARIAAAPVQRKLVVTAATRVGHQSWPKELAEQFKAVRAALVAQGTPARAEQIAGQFVRVRRDRVAEVLETLVSVGQARLAGRGLYAV